MDRFLALTVFAKVVEKGSFVRAAEDLGLSPASVTEHVQSLERHLKTRLLNRTTRRLSLTDEGAVYHEQCRDILAQLAEADDMLASRRTSPRGLLRVMMPVMLGTRLFIPALPVFFKRFPDLRVEITLSAAAPDFVGQNLDLCLAICLDPKPAAVFRPLGLVRIKTCASPAYLRRRGRPRTIADLERHELIGARNAPGVFSAMYRFEEDGRAVSREFDWRLVSDAGDSQRVAALAGLGIMQGAEYAVRDLLDEGKLVAVLEDRDWSGPPLGVMHPENRFVPPKVRVFVDFAREVLHGRIDPWREDWDNR